MSRRPRGGQHLLFAGAPQPFDPVVRLGRGVREGSGIAFDAELLYVSALLHDIGLVAEFDNHGLSFEDAGGHVAWVFTAGAGWPAERRQRAAEIIVKHMWAEVDADQDPEGFLLERSTGLDIWAGVPKSSPTTCARPCWRAIPGLAGRRVHSLLPRPSHPQAPLFRGVAMRRDIANRLAANPLDKI